MWLLLDFYEKQHPQVCHATSVLISLSRSNHYCHLNIGLLMSQSNKVTVAVAL
jgi:hypothetical protein